MKIDFKDAFTPERELLPQQAVVFYGDGKLISGGTVHDMRMEGGRAVAGAGRLLTAQGLKALAQCAAEGLRRAPEIQPEQVLVATDELLVWWRRAGPEDLAFDVDWNRGEAGRARLQGVMKRMPLPALVFVLHRSRACQGIWQGVYVYAMGEDKRPTADTPMFRAPLLNLNDDGAVCWGDGELPKGRTSADIAQWESLFFSSKFTHYNHSSPVKSKDCYEWIADFCDSSAKEFPSDHLLPMRETLGQIINRHFGAMR